MFIFTSSNEFDISIVCYLTAWNSLKHLTAKFKKRNIREKHSILNKPKLIRMFCFWMNFIAARNFKIFFTFLSYDESVLVLWKKMTILEKARFSNQDTTLREWQTDYFFNTNK